MGGGSHKSEEKKTSEEKGESESSSSSSSQSLSDIAAEICKLIEERTPQYLTGVTPELHVLPPLVPRAVWAKLGEEIRKAENPSTTSIPGQCWISIRSDGNNFSRVIKEFRAVGIFQDGDWSPSFAKIMVTCCNELMELFQAKCGFTQSDELMILIPPAGIVRGVQEVHTYNGRVQKYCSLAAAKVSVVFSRELMKICLEKGLTKTCLNVKEPIFDCRVGMFQTKQEAVSLLLWRGYACAVNGVSDAVLKSKIDGSKQMVKEATVDKLEWLAKHNMLPLPTQQSAGSYFVKYRKVVEKMNPETGTPVKCIRGARYLVEGNLLNLWKEGKLFPEDERIV